MKASVRGLIVSVGCLAVVPAAAFVGREEGGRDPRWIDPPPVSVPLAKAHSEVEASSPAAASFLARVTGSWNISIDTRTGRAVSVQGSGIPWISGIGNGVESLEAPALAFLEAHAPLLRPERGILELDRESSSIRDGGRLASLYYRWIVDGVPVERARVFLRLNSGNLTQFGAPLIGPLSTDTEPTIGRAKALGALLDYSRDDELYRLVEVPELRLQPENAGERLDYRLVWVFVYRVHGRFETWEGRVDAHTGRVVAFRDLNAYGRVLGGIYPRSVHEQNEVRVPLPFAMVIANEEPITADAAGGFSYGGGEILAGLSGPWADTSCQICSNPAQPATSTLFGAGRIDFGTGGADATGNGFSTPADRNSFFHTNQVRRIASKWLGGLAWLDGSVLTKTNVQDTCNAFYDGAVNLFRSGDGCANTGEIADVIYHEWAHGLDQATQPGDYATGEGTADLAAMHVTRSSSMGLGFWSSTGNPVRDLDPNGPRGLLTVGNIASHCPPLGTLGPLGYEVHCEGEIYGQTGWDLAQSLVARYGTQTGWRISERLFFTSLADAGGYLPTATLPIYDAYLNADDDDGNLANGTPNAAEIFAAFDRHGIAGAAVPSSPPCTRPSQPTLVATPSCDAVLLSWNPVPGVDHYEILRGELSSGQALFPVAVVPAGETSYGDAQVGPGVDYEYVVLAVDGAGCESTLENPVAARLPDRPWLSVVSVTVDDTPRGNHSGEADPGEEVDLVLRLANHGSLEATNVSATLFSARAGVNLLDGTAAWPQIDPGGEADNLDALRFSAGGPFNPCGSVIDFVLQPSDASGCAADPSYFEISLGRNSICDDTPPCDTPPDFAGLEAAVPGGSCGEIDLSWQPGSSNCVNGGIRYNVYRSVDAGFQPDPTNRIAQELVALQLTDKWLAPGTTYHYLVRASDPRFGEEGNEVRVTVTSPSAPDLRAPGFDGIAGATTGAECGAVDLTWLPGTENCSGPVSYRVYRDTDPLFSPGAANLVGSSTGTSLLDTTPQPGTDYTYVVRARDGAGNEDSNGVRRTVRSGITDRVVDLSSFESGTEGWTVIPPNDAAAGTWEWGDPQGTAEQPENDATDEGTACWITGVEATLSDGSNNDVDLGATTLFSRAYDLTGIADPRIRYARWFTNDLGANPAQDPLYIQISDDDGVTWTMLEQLGAGLPLQWITVEHGLPTGVSATAQMRFRFVASDFYGASVVEAGIDDFAVLDREQGCTSCALPVSAVGTILARRAGDDVVLDWSADPTPGDRFAVYRLTGPSFDQPVPIGTVRGRSFLDPGAAVAPEDLAYRVSALDTCGNESPLE